MFCNKCGRECADGNIYCPNCNNQLVPTGLGFQNNQMNNPNNFDQNNNGFNQNSNGINQNNNGINQNSNGNKKDKTLLIVSISIGVVLLIIIAFLTVTLLSKSSTSSPQINPKNSSIKPQNESVVKPQNDSSDSSDSNYDDDSDEYYEEINTVLVSLTFNVDNNKVMAKYDIDIYLQGDGEQQFLETLANGQSRTFKIDLAPGSYTVIVKKHDPNVFLSDEKFAVADTIWVDESNTEFVYRVNPNKFNLEIYKF